MTAPPFADIAPRAAAAAAAALPGGPAAAARAVVALADRTLTQAQTQPDLAAKLAGLACGAGCAWCCHQMVGVTPAEQALLAEGIAALCPADRDGLRARTAALVRRSHGMDQRQWWAARLPCPLLAEDGRCSIHPTRPLPCRGYTSANVDLCRRSLAGEGVRIPMLAAQFGIYGHAQAGLAQALAAAGIDPGPITLVEAVAAVLGV